MGSTGEHAVSKFAGFCRCWRARWTGWWPNMKRTGLPPPNVVWTGPNFPHCEVADERRQAAAGTPGGHHRRDRVRADLWFGHPLSVWLQCVGVEPVTNVLAAIANALKA